MKQTLSVLLLAATIISSCSKSASVKPPTINTNVTITDSVKIGSQYWTTVNYNGDGGQNYGNTTTNNPAWGKLYTNAEASALKLPGKWRIPSSGDYNNLMIAVGSTTKDGNGNILLGTGLFTLLSTTSWIIPSGTNTTGFNAVAAGYEDGNDFVEASGTSTNYVSTAFITTSTFTGTNGGTANLIIYEDTFEIPTIVEGVITSLSGSDQTSGTSRASIRFVRDI
jgi:uncharacterized protein (TIGR02145 family)